MPFFLPCPSYFFMSVLYSWALGVYTWLIFFGFVSLFSLNFHDIVHLFPLCLDVNTAPERGLALLEGQHPVEGAGSAGPHREHDPSLRQGQGACSNARTTERRQNRAVLRVTRPKTSYLSMNSLSASVWNRRSTWTRLPQVSQYDGMSLPFWPPTTS